MKRLFPLAATLLLLGCAWTTGPQEDYPEEKMMQTGSHIPIKDKSAGKAQTSGDADAMMRSQKVLGTTPGGGRSN
jgi:outer membrane biogenesis lipoprotein LolB